MSNRKEMFSDTISAPVVLSIAAPGPAVYPGQEDRGKQWLSIQCGIAGHLL